MAAARELNRLACGHRAQMLHSTHLGLHVNTWAPQIDQAHCSAGDLNTVLHYRDELGATLQCPHDQHAQLEAAGWRDAWIERNPTRRPLGTWFSPGYSNPFRFDHASLSPTAPRTRRRSTTRTPSPVSPSSFGARRLTAATLRAQVPQDRAIRQARTSTQPNSGPPENQRGPPSPHVPTPAQFHSNRADSGRTSGAGPWVLTRPNPRFAARPRRGTGRKPGRKPGCSYGAGRAIHQRRGSDGRRELRSGGKGPAPLSSAQRRSRVRSTHRDAKLTALVAGSISSALRVGAGSAVADGDSGARTRTHAGAQLVQLRDTARPPT